MRPRRYSVWSRLAHDRLAMAGILLVSVFVILALAAPLLAPHDPAASHPVRRLEGPSREYLLGTDPLGRDILSRLLWGARWSLGAAAAAAALIMTIGVVLGSASGYFGGLLDEILMRVVDVLLAFPSLLLALAVSGMLGPGLVNVIIGLVSVWWVEYARIVRGLVLAARERQYVEAARCLGASHWRIIVRHIWPNILPSVIVLATLDMGALILAFSGLNFLGLGAQPPTPEWGSMLNEGRAFLITAPQLMVYPGLAISLVAIGFNLLGDGLRDVLDPRSSPQRS